jgi:hypothetical protein
MLTLPKPKLAQLATGTNHDSCIHELWVASYSHNISSESKERTIEGNGPQLNDAHCRGYWKKLEKEMEVS